MTMLTIVQNVATQAGFPSPTTVASNQDETAKRLLALLNLQGKMLMRAFDWSVLQLEHTFSTTDTVSQYALPSDFDRFIPTTNWDRTMFWALQGPLTPQEWQVFKSGIIQSSPRRKFRITPSAAGANQFTIFPTPGVTGDDLVFEYVSNKWAKDSGGTLIAAFTADTDTAIISETMLELGLLWRFLKSLGLAYAEEKLEFERELSKEQARDGGMRPLYMAEMPPVGPNIPETGYGQ